MNALSCLLEVSGIPTTLPSLHFLLVPNTGADPILSAPPFPSVISFLPRTCFQTRLIPPEAAVVRALMRTNFHQYLLVSANTLSFRPVFTILLIQLDCLSIFSSSRSILGLQWRHSRTSVDYISSGVVSLLVSTGHCAFGISIGGRWLVVSKQVIRAALCFCSLKSSPHLAPSTAEQHGTSLNLPEFLIFFCSVVRFDIQLTPVSGSP